MHFLAENVWKMSVEHGISILRAREKERKKNGMVEHEKNIFKYSCEQR